jgi:hypothetical protein
VYGGDRQMNIEEEAQTLRKQWYARTRNILVPWEWAKETERKAWRNLAFGGFFPEVKLGIDVFKSTVLYSKRKDRGNRKPRVGA